MKSMKKMFMNKQGNYRIGWQVIFAIALFIALSMISIIAAGIIYINVGISSFSDMINDTMNSNWGNALASVFAILLYYFVFVVIAKYHKDLWHKIGFTRHKAFSMFFWGLLSGILFCLIYIIPLYFTNQLKIEFVPFTINVFMAFLAGAIIQLGTAFSEEIIFRGYIQYYLEKKYKIWGIVATSLLFAVMHFNNVPLTPLSLICLFVGGIAFSLMRVVTQGIWFPIGFHFAWNWLEATFFGLNNENPLKRYFFTTVANESVWTGEGGSLGLAVILSMVLFIGILSSSKIKHMQRK